jgi:hypothetical protein
MWGCFMGWTGDLNLRDTLKGANINRPENLLSLAPVIHKAFGGLYLGFDPIDGESDTYTIVYKPREGMPKLTLPDRVTFKRADGDNTPLPDRNLLKYHCALVKVFNSVARADVYDDEWFDEPEFTRVRATGEHQLFS